MYPYTVPEATARAHLADPNAQPWMLAAIAEQHPALHPLVAAHPAAPPELLAWLAQSPDPAVHRALAARVDATVIRPQAYQVPAPLAEPDRADDVPDRSGAGLRIAVVLAAIAALVMVGIVVVLRTPLFGSTAGSTRTTTSARTVTPSASATPVATTTTTTPSPTPTVTTPTPTSTPTTPTLDPTALAQVQALSDIASRSAASRTKVVRAAAVVSACESEDYSAQIAVFERAADERATLADDAAAAQVDSIPDGARLAGNLADAMRYSGLRDQELAQWASRVQTLGCDAVADSGSSYSAQVTKAKNAFVKQWNSQIAPTFDVARLDRDTL